MGLTSVGDFTCLRLVILIWMIVNHKINNQYIFIFRTIYLNPGNMSGNIVLLYNKAIKGHRNARSNPTQ